MQTGKIELQALGTLKDGTGSAGASGQVFSSTLTSTAWIPAPTGATPIGTNTFDLSDTNNVVAVGNVTWASRIFVVNALVVNRIACYSNSAGAGNARMGIYTDAGTSIIAQSTTNSSIVAGLNKFTLASDATLSSGTFYYIVLQSISASVSYFINAGYTGATTFIRARYVAGTASDPNSGMVSSITGITASANALWSSVYKE